MYSFGQGKYIPKVYVLLVQGWRTYVRRKISSAFGIHRCPIFFFLFSCTTSVPILWRICLYTRISGCVESVYELPLLPNNIASVTFSDKWKQCEVFTGYLSLRAPAWRWMGEYVTLDKTLHSLLFKKEVVTALLPLFRLSAFLEETVFFFSASQPIVGLYSQHFSWLLASSFEVSRSHTTTRHSR